MKLSNTRYNTSQRTSRAVCPSFTYLRSENSPSHRTNPKPLILTILLLISSLGCGQVISTPMINELSEAQTLAQIKTIAAAQPNQAHGILNKLVGKWKAACRYQQSLGEPVAETKARMTSRWILDGRFIEDHYLGTVAGKPLEGRGFTGYDNIRQQYVSIWVDNMSTGLMISHGYYNSNTQQLHFLGSYIDPVTKIEQRTESITSFINDDTIVYELFELSDSNQRFKTLEITYTRG